mmetsp:Transcript_1706/g.4137  ORF Transcript_1706/g.4137 Transcript_1706/m.4137 type:complete len:247 (-) Transcript_1706:296-1036(-)
MDVHGYGHLDPEAAADAARPRPVQVGERRLHRVMRRACQDLIHRQVHFMTLQLDARDLGGVMACKQRLGEAAASFGVVLWFMPLDNQVIVLVIRHRQKIKGNHKGADGEGKGRAHPISVPCPQEPILVNHAPDDGSADAPASGGPRAHTPVVARVCEGGHHRGVHQHHPRVEHHLAHHDRAHHAPEDERRREEQLRHRHRRARGHAWSERAGNRKTSESSHRQLVATLGVVIHACMYVYWKGGRGG